MRFHARLLVLLVFFSLWQVPATRADFSFNYGLFVREEYNDNIDLDPKGEEKKDFITTIGPNFSLLWETRVVDLSLNYGLNFRKYVKHSEKDEISLRQAQRADAEATFTLYPEILFLHVSDIYQRVPIDEGGKGGLDNELVNLTDSNTLIVNPYLKFQPWSTTGLQLDYIYRNLWYRKKEGIDSETHTFAGTISHEISARLSSSLRGDYSLYRPKKEDREGFLADSRYDSKSLTFSLNWLTTDQLTLSGYFGRSWIDYKETEDTDTDFYGANGEFQLNQYVIFGGGYNESINQSVSDGTTKNKGYTAFVSYKNSFSVTLTGFKRDTEYLVQDRTDHVKGVSVGGDWPWSEKTGINYFASYSNFDENNDQPGNNSSNYERIGFRAGYYYLTRIGRFSLGYTYNQNFSDDNEDEYVQNIVWAQMNFILSEIF